MCCGHDAPWDYFSKVYLERPPLALVLGPRGGGKSYLSALDAHLTSRFHPGHGTRVLGGSRSQSEQVYQALREMVSGGDESVTLDRLTREGAYYANGSEVRVLAASPTSVRGPHVASLKLDEVDEIHPDVREAAMGMCMNRKEMSASVVMTSTWHRVGGPMSTLMERARQGDFPLYSFCAFEILESCPEELSGPALEKCPACPLMKWCHADRDRHPSGLPKAKRSHGHYAVASLIQKARVVSARTFEADYLCIGPKSEGQWFPAFSAETHVSEVAEYDPKLPVHLAIDSGVFTGAVFFQIARVPVVGGEPTDEVRVFADYLSEGVTAESAAKAILDVARQQCNGRIDFASTDPSGSSRNAIGPTVLAEYARGGLRDLRSWPRGARVRDGLALLESFVQPADGVPRLILNPRCKATLFAFQSYRRMRRDGQWGDAPQDPQHPHEDLIDALRGGLVTHFPEGRFSRPSLPRVHARKVF
ncbi:MAG: hypothetical protein ABI353_04715 [Isosphaeraceae bacterium]